MMDRDTVLAALHAAQWVIEGPKGAALALGVNPHTLRARLQRMGIVRPPAPVVAEAHAPTAPLLGRLARLRAHARVIRSTYRDTPARAAMLRENEADQRAVIAELRALLGERPVFGGVRGSQAPGALRPAWSARW